MSGDVGTDSEETRELLEQAAAGDRGAFDRLFARHRDYLRRLVELDLDPRLQPRVDPSDIVQEAHLEAVRRLPDYLCDRPLPFRLWLRQIAHDRLLKARRFHLGAARRTVAREVRLSDRSTLLLAQQLPASGPSPSHKLDQEEQVERLRRALEQLSDADRELLLLRNYEGLSYEEVGYVLKIEPAAARKRHSRALVRLHGLLSGGGTAEGEP